MKLLQIVITLVCLFAFSSCSKPEEKIVDRLEDMEVIMKDHMEKPAEGVDELIIYAEKHGPDTVKLALEAGIKLANIEGDGDRENRLKEVSETLRTAFKNFNGTSKQFRKAVRSDEKARAKLKEYSKKWDSLGDFMREVTM